RSVEEAVGRVDALDTRAAVEHWKAEGLDLAPVLAEVAPRPGSALHRAKGQEHGLERALDNQLIALAAEALEHGAPVKIELPVRNVNRTVGTMLGHEVTKRYRGDGLPDGTIDVSLTGSAGQSFGAFLPRGITLRLFGDANDYVAKGLSGGRVVVRPDVASVLGEADVIAGNVIGYGATAGQVHLRGVVGERFAVRNSGATLVVEGVGDHGCEYMTGGTVMVIGPTGRNFGAGMSGGVAYVLDLRDGAVNGTAVSSGALQLTRLTDADQDVVATLLREHVDATGSPLAGELLADLPAAFARFTRVLPTEFDRMRTALARAEADGLDVHAPGVWDQILEVSRG
ncbi:MAG TPA: glutamate synthase subunit alpha, partial [Actinotalea sp.]|nr:glutamate synthase subunit alpha [Actinotalea sp.]